MEKGDVSITAIIFIICGLFVLIFAGALAFKVPGLFGQLLGYIQTGLIAVGSSLLDFLANIFGAYFSAFATALGVTLNVVLPVLALKAVWPTLTTLGKIGVYALREGWKQLTTKVATYAGVQFEVPFSWRLYNFGKALKEGLTRGWSLIRSGLTRQAIVKGLTNILKTAALFFVVSLGTELLLTHFGFPQWIDNLNLPGQGFTIGGFSWSWGSATTSGIGAGLAIAAGIALGWTPIGWGLLAIGIGSIIIGGFVH